MPAPIALFAFNRPKHLAQTIAALAANELASESDLYIFCDGPRNEQDSERCAEVVTIAKNATGFKSLTVQTQEKNKGLAPSIIEGVSSMVNVHGHVIVLEDDLITSPYFLRYMNDGLTVYEDNPQVASIHGYCFPHHLKSDFETFFLRGADCWGWATWKRAWDLGEWSANILIKEIEEKQLVASFNLGNASPRFELLNKAASGEVSSWAIRWHASMWLRNMYTLYPVRSLVLNIGTDGSGHHGDSSESFKVALNNKPVQVVVQHVQRSELMYQEDIRFSKACYAEPVSMWVRSIIRRILRLFAFR